MHDRVVSRLFGQETRDAAFGRYTLLDKLGQGSLGVVYAAYDPELERKVAIKVVARPGTDERLVREARTLARLSHPNIVGIHDVGRVDDALFIAMELVRGQTLTRWLQEDRPWRAIIDVFRQAGRGLAAAHGEGVVHRDFKPDNVVVGDDGRVRVLDFGLARHLPKPGTVDTTQVGGTPAYMAPEQFRGVADPRSDQFAYCVALFEALYGHRPFGGGTLEDLRTAVESGVVVSPSSRHVPARVHRALLRGLRPDPSHRHDSMDALVTALESAQRMRSWVTLLALSGPIALVAAFHERPCTPPTDHLDTWNDVRRRSVAARLESVLVPASLEAMLGQLDDHADAWHAMWKDACEATARGAQSAELLDLRMACLDRVNRRVHTFIDTLERESPSSLRDAPEAVTALTKLAPCANTVGLIDAGRPPPSTEAWIQVAERLAAAEVWEALGKPHRKLAQLEKIDLEPLEEEDVLESLWVASFLGAALNEVERFADAETLLARNLVRAERFPRVPQVRANLMAHLAVAVAEGGGRTTEAIRLAEQAIEAYGALRSRPRRELAMAQQVLGLAHHRNLDAPSARRAFEQALELYPRPDAAALGIEDRLRLARLNTALGTAAQDDGALEDALVHHQAGLDLLGTAVADHPVRAEILQNLASVERSLGRTDASIEHLERALAIAEANGAPPEARAWKTMNLGNTLLGAERYEAAYAAYSQAWHLLGDIHSHPIQRAKLHYNTAFGARAVGRPVEALEHLEATLELRRTLYGEAANTLAGPLVVRAQILVDLDRPEEARTSLELALALPEEASLSTSLRAEMRFELARLLPLSAHRRAQALAREAESLFRNAGRDEKADAVARWRDPSQLPRLADPG